MNSRISPRKLVGFPALEHYHAERNHQGLKNDLIEPGETTGSENGSITCRERLDGLLKYYHRRAA